jgi:[ribosomal protein S18]-alanine N-acetyltransferase
MSVIERLLQRAPVDGRGLSITPMRKRDLRQGIMEIEAAAYPVGWSQSVFATEIGQVGKGDRHYAVARRDGIIVGYAGLWFAVDEAHITNVAVAPMARRQGVGRALMLHLAETAIAHGCLGWTLEVRATSAGAQELYREFGFDAVGVRQKYYDNVEDAIVMWCHEMQSDVYCARLDQIREAAHV